MQQIRDGLCRPFAILSMAVVLAALTLSACGSSGSSSTTTATSTAAALAAKTGGSAPGGSTGAQGSTPTTRPRFGALRECMQKHGVQLPTRPGGGLFLGGANLPKGVSRAQLQAAVRKCLGGRPFFGGGGPGSGLRRFSAPALRQALDRFAACLRQNGINVPQPNTSGKGPVFSTKGLDRTSPQFRAATMKCRALLPGAFSVHP